MNFLFYVIAIVIMIAYAWFVTRKTGTRVLLEWYKVVDNKLIRVKPMKKFIGVNTSIGLNEELKLPKSMSKFTIQGIDYDELSMTDRGTPILKLLQVGEGLFVPMKDYGNLFKKRNEIDKNLLEAAQKEAEQRRGFFSKKPKKMLDLKQYLAYFDTYVIDKSVIAWKENKTKEIENRHKEKQDKWAKLGPIVTMIGVSFIAFLILFTANKQATEIVNGALVMAGEEIDQTQSLTEKWLNINNFQTKTIEEVKAEQENEQNANAPPSNK